MSRIKFRGNLPRGECRRLLVHVPKYFSKVIVGVGQLDLALIAGKCLFRRPLQHVKLLQTAREAVVGRHSTSSGKRRRDEPDKAFPGLGIRLEVSEHRVPVAVAGGDRVLERQRAFGRIRLFGGGLGERGVAERDHLVPRADAP